MTKRLRTLIFGESRDPHSPTVFHKLSLIAIFAWVGLGADGLTSTCYGPSEAFLALGRYPHFSVIVALATVATVFLVSASYTQIIELFPTGGGGYLVASKLLSPTCGMISGCALLIDYVLTITVSVASGTDALFSFLPADWQRHKLYFAALGIAVLIYMNLRGVRESVLPLVPFFVAFVGTHIFMIAYAMFTNLPALGGVVGGVASEMRTCRSELGLAGMLVLILRAYGMGAGTYTGIEAVSNGLPILREPKVVTARRTMRYMAVSLSVTAFGLMVAYLLYHVQDVPGKTLNAVACERVVAGWPGHWGKTFLYVTLISEAALLFVAAQTGFLGGPSVLATMAKDRWVPVRFALLSNRLVVQNGILLIGVSALATLLLTGGSVRFLVVLYSINVFITFTFSQLGMVKHWLTTPVPRLERCRKLLVSGSGLALTLAILLCLVVLKFNQGGWITLVTTLGLVGVVSYVRNEYRQTQRSLERLDDLVSAVESGLGQPKPTPAPPEDSGERRSGRGRTAVLFVNGYGGVGLHSVLAVIRLFGGIFRRFIFVQVGVIDAAAFKGVQEVQALGAHTQQEVEKYVALMQRHGYEAEGVTVSGLDVVEEVEGLAPALLKRFPGAIFFGGQLVFKNDSLMTRMLHNFTIFDIQRSLYQRGIQFVILPIRV